MKKNIHPKYFEKALIVCSCGATLETGATVEKMQVEVCSHCHPFYTGKKKIVDTTGRVERFKKLAEKSAEKKEIIKKAKAQKKKAKSTTVKSKKEKISEKTDKRSGKKSPKKK